MNLPSRRSVLAGSAASLATGLLAASSAFGQQRRRPGSAEPRGGAAGEVDCIVVGAGAAGIAAARRLVAAKRSVVVLEAANRIGGRCFAETASFGVPFDRGAHLIFHPGSNPLTQAAARIGLEIYPAPYAQHMRIGPRNAREGELEDFLAASGRASRAIADAVRGKGDTDCASVMPRDLGDWRPSVEFALGPYFSSKELGAISAADLTRAGERNAAAICRQGYGALLAKYAEDLPVRLDTAVTLVDITNRGARIELTTTKGTVTGHHVIITASPNVILDRIKFDGGLPKRHQDALENLRLGSFENIALELTGNPLGLPADEMVFEKASGPHTGALTANIGGTALSVVSVGGKFARDLAEQGDKAMVEFAVEWLAGMYGAGVKKALRRSQVTQWSKDPWIQGATATAAPRWQAARRILMEPIRNRVFFAGEAAHETAWGTVNGAWESGVRAADAVVRHALGQPELPSPKAEPEPVATVKTPAGPQRRTPTSGWCFTNPGSCAPRAVRP
jgi:monoamine oxidase